ncbi:phage tail spike protein [Streptococcus sp. A11]|uniref:phage tail spike protein n=1 Tax=Streptococcus sp. A11 TaxID=3373124 RepID=UPI00374D804B
MLHLLDKNVKTVKWNGIPLHEASSAIVKEEVNGDFILTVRYPITDIGIYQLIKEDMLIKAPTPVLGPQLFRIKKPVENDDSLDITAYHITDDIMQRSIRSVSVVGQGCALALSQMVQNAKTDLGTFSFTSDIMDSRTFNTTETETLYSVLLDGKHSIVGTWEGELVRDNFAMSIKRSRGADRGVVITTHKNLKSYQRTKNSQSVVTRIHAKSTFKAEGAEEETTITVTVDSPLIGNYPYINEKDYENNNAKTVDELRKWAEAKFKNEGIDKISDAIEIEAYELDGQVIHLGDTVNIKSKKHSVDIYKKAIAYEFNALTEEYISITFDDKPGVGGSGVSSGVSNAADVILGVNANAQEVAIERAVRNANQAFDAEFDKRVESIHDGIEQAKADAELYADTIKQNIDAEIAQVNQSMQAQSEEHDRQVADILSRTQSVEELANQAQTDAASAITQALQSKDEAIADARAQVATVNQALNTVRADLQNQAKAQSNLTNRVTTVENIANGTKTTVSELSKTVDKTTNDIASVTDRTKVVEDGLAGTKVDLSLVKINAEETQQNLATYKTTVDRKLEELTTSTQSLDGKISTASAKVDTVAGQIRTELTRVEGKIPTALGGRNYILKSDVYATSGSRYFDTSPEFIDYAYSGKYVTISLDIKGENLVPDSRGLSRIGCELRLNLSDGKVLYLQCQKIVSGTQPRERISVTRKIPEGVSVVSANKVNMYVQVGGTALAGRPKFELSSIPTDWSPAPEDINSELSSTKTLITQTAEGQTQLSNRLTTTQDKVSTAETKINQLIRDVSSKVSQTDYNTLTGRVDSAETAITQNATEISKRLTSSQVESAITGKGYQTKAQVDNNITGRGYITSSALQPYALATTVQNLVRETADSFSRTISETKALIPTEVGGRNYLLNSKTEISGGGAGKVISLSPELLDNLNKIKSVTISCDVEGTNVATKNSRKRFGLACSVEINGIVNYWEVWQAEDTIKKRISQTFTVPEGKSITKFYSPVLWIQADGDIKVSNPKIEFGVLPTDWSPAPEDLATVTALHNVTDTVDSHTRTIGAVGTAGSILDNVSKVTQTAAGLVQEVSGTNGLKTQVSQLAGSWAVKNLTSSGTVLNQLNLNKDGSVKIDGKLVQITGTTYIQDGVITSAKIAGLDAGKITTGTLDAARIAVNSIDGSKMVFDQAFVNKMTANEAYLEQIFAKDAFITQVQAVTLSASKIAGGVLTATNEAMQMDLNNANISFNTNAAINFNSANNALVRRRGTHTAFLHFNDVASSSDANAGGVYAGLGVTSSGDGINSESSGRFSGIRIFRSAIGYNHNPTLDHVEIYGDTIYFKDAFNESRGYVFKTFKTVNQTIDMNLYINAIKAIAHCLNHLRSNNWDWKLPNLRNAISGLMDSYINKTDFYNKLQV